MSALGRGAAMKADVPSPCISVCVMDTENGWCAGCFRTIDEIAAWGALDDAAKRAVLARLSARRAQAGAHAQQGTASAPAHPSDPDGNTAG